MSERRLSKRTSAIKKREALAVKLEKRKLAVSRKLGRQKPVQSQEDTPVVDEPIVDADTNSVASLEWDHNESPPSFLTAENSSESFRSDIDQVLDEIHRLFDGSFAYVDPNDEILYPVRTSSTNPNLLDDQGDCVAPRYN